MNYAFKVGDVDMEQIQPQRGCGRNLNIEELLMHACAGPRKVEPGTMYEVSNSVVSRAVVGEKLKRRLK